jgi:hypothetical protein
MEKKIIFDEQEYLIRQERMNKLIAIVKLVKPIVSNINTTMKLTEEQKTK